MTLNDSRQWDNYQINTFVKLYNGNHIEESNWERLNLWRTKLRVKIHNGSNLKKGTFVRDKIDNENLWGTELKRD